MPNEPVTKSDLGALEQRMQGYFDGGVATLRQSIDQSIGGLSSKVDELSKQAEERHREWRKANGEILRLSKTTADHAVRIAEDRGLLKPRRNSGTRTR